jgi:hypothetical protein
VVSDISAAMISKTLTASSLPQFSYKVPRSCIQTCDFKMSPQIQGHYHVSTDNTILLGVIKSILIKLNCIINYTNKLTPYQFPSAQSWKKKKKKHISKQVCY